MAQITGETMIGELLMIDSSLAPILMNIGMHCLGCPSSQMETVAEAAMVHGIEPDSLVDEINAYLKEREESGAYDTDVYQHPDTIPEFSVEPA